MKVRPGIYMRGDLEYSAIEAINYSTLKEMARSPLHYQHALKFGKDETTAMAKGTAVHLAMLEPERFESEYAIFTGARRAGKAWDEFEANALASGKMVLKESELEDAKAIVAAIKRHDRARGYFEGGNAEVTIVWQDEETGLMCKGRLDYLRTDNIAVDLKTSATVEPFWFGRNCANLQYHVQAAMYSDAVAQITNKECPFVVVAVESKRPHDVVPYTLGDDVMGPGRDVYRQLLRRVKECHEVGLWPGYANGLEMALTLPAWVARDDEDDLAALGLE